MRGSVSTQALRNLNAQLSWDANSGVAVHDHDRHRRQRRFDLQRSAAADAAQQRAAAVAIDVLRERVVHDSDRQAARARGRSAGRGRTAGPRWRAAASGRGGRQKGITISLSAQNLTNRSNFSGFSGVMTSQYFLQATSVSNPRQVDLSLRFNF